MTEAPLPDPMTGAQATDRVPEPLLAEASTARSSVVVATSLLLSSLLGGLLALLISVIVGEGPESDGFLAAYSVYLVFILFGSTLRIALVPLFGSTQDEGEFLRRASSALRMLLAVSAVATLVVLVASPLAGKALVPNGEREAQDTAAVSVAILALAAYCQVWSAMLSAVLGAVRRFVSSALFYLLSSAVAVALGAGLMEAVGIEGAAIGALGAAVVLLATHLVYTRRLQFAAFPEWRAMRGPAAWRLAATALAGASVPVVLQVTATISLAAVSGRTGAVTAYSYAYFVTVLTTGLTAGVIGLVTMPNLIAALHERGATAAEDYLAEMAPFSVFLYVPLAAGFAVFGRPIVDAVLDGPLTPDTIDILWDAARIFLVMGLAWVLLAPLLTVTLSLQRYNSLAAIAACMIPVHALLVLPAASIGPVTAAAAHAVSGTLLVIAVTVMVFGRRAPGAMWRAIRACLPVAPLALVFPAAGLFMPDTLTGALVGLLVATGIYMALGVVVWRSVGGRALELLRGRA